MRLLPGAAHHPDVRGPKDAGKTLLVVTADGTLVGVLAAADTLRPEIPASLRHLRELDFDRIELLTGDNQATAAVLADQLSIPYRADLLPRRQDRPVSA
jgi:Cu+-exporting ATPase